MCKLRKILLVALVLAVAAVSLIILFPRLGVGPHGGPGGTSGQGYSWISALASGVLAVGAIGIVIYALMYPAIQITAATKTTEAPKEFKYETVNKFEGVLRVLEPEEQQVCKALYNRGGSTTQKEITNITGFSKVKTHRILSRLASRRIVSVEKAGKTNLIHLSEWVLSKHEGE